MLTQERDMDPPSFEMAVWVMTETCLLLAGSLASKVLLGLEPRRALLQLVAARAIGLVIKFMWPGRGDNRQRELSLDASTWWSKTVRESAERRMTLARETERHAERRREEADRDAEEQQRQLQRQKKRQQDYLEGREDLLKQQRNLLDEQREQLQQEREELHQQKQQLLQQQHQVQQQHHQQQLLQIDLDLVQQHPDMAPFVFPNPPHNPFHRVNRGRGRGSRSNTR